MTYRTARIESLLMISVFLGTLNVAEHLQAQGGEKPRLFMDDPLRGRAADILSAETRNTGVVGAKLLCSISGHVYLVALPLDSEWNGKIFDGYMVDAFGTNRWDRGEYNYKNEKPRTLTLSKQAGRWTRNVSDSGKFLGYSLTSPEKSVRLVTRDENGTGHEWLREEVTRDLGGTGKSRLRVAEGEFQDWYLSFGEREEINEKTKWKDSDGKSREMPPHVRYPAILIKEPDDRSLLRELGYYPEGK